MSTGKLAARVAALENEVARLRRDLENERAGEKPWWEHIAGTFAQDRVYKEAMRLGQQERRSQRSPASRRRRDSHFNEPRYLEIIRPDELTFVDLSKCISFITEEVPVA